MFSFFFFFKNSSTADKLNSQSWTSSQTATGRDARRSNSSSYVMLGGHLIAASATTQNVVATSSGEAEFYALTKSASRALGAVAMAADTSKVVKPRVDTTIASRRAVERVTHLHTQVLWGSTNQKESRGEGRTAREEEAALHKKGWDQNRKEEEEVTTG